MSETNSIFFGKKQSNIYKKRNHRTTLKCLKECSNYNLSISCNQRNETNFSFFSKILHSYQNNIFAFNNLYPSEIISSISEKTTINKENNLISCIYKIIDYKSDNKIDQTLENEQIQLPLESEKLNLNFMNVENYISRRGINLLLKFDLNDDKRPIVFDKNILYNILSYKINAKLHDGQNLFDKDIFFLVDIKKIVKSIQIRLENLKKNENKNIGRINEIFVPLLEYENIGFIISPNYKSFPLDLRAIKTNFNSIVKHRFVLKSILISLNISSLNQNSSLISDNEKFSNLSDLSLKKIENVKDKSNDYIADENTSQSSNHNSNSPKIFEKGDKQLNEIMDFQNINKSLNNSFILPNINLSINNINNDEISYTNNSYILDNNNNQYNNSYYSIKAKRKFDLKKNIQYNYSNYSLYNINNIKNKYSSYHNNYNINTIIFNSNDIFSKTLFNRYQDKSNSTCNLQILMEFLKMKMKKSLSDLTIYDFFHSFYKVSSLSLKIPFFKNDGKLIQSTLTPSLNELNLYINNSTLIKKLENKFKISQKNSESSTISRSSDEGIITKQIDDFVVSILENKSLVKISFKEHKPYYLTDSLYDKLEKLINNLKYIKKINIDKNVLLEKSYISIQWNIINGSNNLSSSFISYYLFNGNMLGVLSDIKEKETNFWLNSIEEINNKRIKVDYNYLPKENYFKIYDFINNNI